MQNLWSVFLTSFRLGLTSFGGPIAHLGYFERTYVRQKKWISHEDFSRIVALCQLLPGPTSSQVNFLIGQRRAGWIGAITSWTGFTLPSALLMYAFAVLAPKAHGQLTEAVLHGLKLMAVAVVAQAVWSMATRLCPDRIRAGIAITCMIILLLFGEPFAQVVAIGFGAAAGYLWCRGARQSSGGWHSPVDRRMAWSAFVLFLFLLVLLPVLDAGVSSRLVSMIDIVYRSGALVFGGGHVVLPLLRDAVVPAGMMTDDTFLAGYGVAQAMPGPLFSFAVYLGAMSAPEGSSTLWGFIALLFIFLPGLLLAAAGTPLWQWIEKRPLAQGALAGVNASVVGILGAALYSPVWQTAILAKADVAIAVVSYFLLQHWKVPPILVTLFCVTSAAFLKFF